MIKGEIWWAVLPSPRGSEPAKERPVLVIQGDDYNNSKISTVICVAITKNTSLATIPPNFLLEKGFSHLDKSSVANFSQITTVDKSFFKEMVCMLPKQFIQKIDNALISIFDIKSIK